MIVDKDTARLICKLEYELGSQTYNPHSYNGWTGEEGCGFKYPVKYCKNKNALIKQELTKNKNEINYIDPQCINTMKYVFGLNHLYVGKGIIKMLECLEEVYNIDFNKLEQKRLEKKKKALVKNQENLDKGKRIKIGPGKFKIGIDIPVEEFYIINLKENNWKFIDVTVYDEEGQRKFSIFSRDDKERITLTEGLYLKSEERYELRKIME